MSFRAKELHAALDAFSPLLKSKEGTVAQRNQAAEHSAKCLEMLGKRDEAMDLYLKVLYGRVAGDDCVRTAGARFFLAGGSRSGGRHDARIRTRIFAARSKSTSGSSKSAARTSRNFTT